MRRGGTSLAFASLSVTTLLAARLAVASPVLIDLGTLGGTISRGGYVNNAGQAAGDSFIEPGIEHAFLFSGGTMVDLGTLGGQESHATALNDAGHVVGWSNPVTCHPGVFAGNPTCLPDEHPFLHDGSTMADLGTLGGPVARAVAINASGQVAGWSLNSADEMHAFLFDDGVLMDLGTGSATGSFATELNDAGQVVGVMTFSNTSYHAFLYADGVMSDLGTLGGLKSVPTDINASGHVVGVSTADAAELDYRAFVYHDGQMTDLGPVPQLNYPPRINDAGQVILTRLLPSSAFQATLYDNGTFTPIVFGSGETGARAINASGQVAGVSLESFEGFIYAGGTATGLGTLGGTGSSPSDINDAGLVTGSADVSEDQFFTEHAFLGAVCPTQPRHTCRSGSSSLRIVRASEPGGNKLRWKWKWDGGPAVVPSDLGDPGVGTSFQLCIYDSVADVDSPVGRVFIAAGSGWRNTSAHDWLYRSASGGRDGVRSLAHKMGRAGRSRVQLVASGAMLPLPSPFGTDRFFSQDSHVTVQLIETTSSSCWTSEFTSASANDPGRFRSRTQ